MVRLVGTVDSDGRSVAVVVLDTLRKDAFDERFDWLPGLRFERAYSPSNWTVPVHASLFAGRYASELGVHAGDQHLDCPEPVLAERLSEAGYATAAFSANVNVSQPFGFDRGFDEFAVSWRLAGLDEAVYDWQQFVAETRDSGPLRYLRALAACLDPEYDTVASLRRGAVLKLRSMGLLDRPDDDGARAALSFVRDRSFGDREFCFLNLMEAHGPYAPPEEYVTCGSRERLLEETSYNAMVATAGDGPPGDPALIRDAYDDAVRYLADVYRDLFAELEAAFDVVVTLSDHGELFGRYGVWQHAYGVYPELVHVPLCISGDALPDGHCEDVVSLLDVHRTVLELTGVAGDSAGEPLVEPDGEGGLAPAGPGHECVAEYHGLTDLNRSALVGAGFDPEPYETPLFGVAGPDLPYTYQTRDATVTAEGGDDPVLAAADGEDRTLAAAEARIEAHRERTEHRDANREAPSGREAALSESVRQRLEDLGYG